MADYVVVRSKDLETGGHEVTVRHLPSDQLITVRVPPRKATSTGIAEAISAAIELRAQRPPRQ